MSKCKEGLFTQCSTLFLLFKTENTRGNFSLNNISPFLLPFTFHDFIIIITIIIVIIIIIIIIIMLNNNNNNVNMMMMMMMMMIMMKTSI